MTPLETLLDDLRTAIGDPMLCSLMGGDVDASSDRMLRELTARANDPARLVGWLVVQLGMIGALQVQQRLGLRDATDRSPEAIVHGWLRHRGIGSAVELRVRPHQLAKRLEEAAHQASSEQVKYDSRRMLVDALKLLLRYMAFFFEHEILKAGGAPLAEVDIGGLPLEALCELLDTPRPVVARPYQHDCDAIQTLGAGRAHGALMVIASAGRDHASWSPEQDSDFAAAVLALLAEWHHDRHILPMGCAVKSYLETEMYSQAECRDEANRELLVQGMKFKPVPSDAFLLNAAESGRVWAPKLRILPNDANWSMHQYVDFEMDDSQAPRDLVFISYSHADKAHRERLETVLAPLVRNKAIQKWSDKDIDRGAVWHPEIDAALRRTRVCVCLLSPEYLDSSFIQDKELPVIFEQVEKGRIKLLWVLLRPCMWKETVFAKYQAAIATDRDLSQCAEPEFDAALVELGGRIREAYVAD